MENIQQQVDRLVNHHNSQKNNQSTQIYHNPYGVHGMSLDTDVTPDTGFPDSECPWCGEDNEECECGEDDM